VPMPLRKLRRPAEKMVKRSPLLKKAYYRAAGLYRGARVRLAGVGRAPVGGELAGGVNPGNIVWIFCTQRSGSTWLRRMLHDIAGGEVWEEPQVAVLFGTFYDRSHQAQRYRKEFVLGEPTRPAWIRAMRHFVLEAARASNPSVGLDDLLVVKEPGGATGAPLIMGALPESRMMLLVRDPRDFVASLLDAQSEGAWMRAGQDEDKRRQGLSTEQGVRRFVRNLAIQYVRQVTNGKKAYDAHRGRKSLVRYEDLRTEPVATMKRLCSQLEIATDEEEIRRVVERHSWERVPEDEKGSGKFYRKAKPGSWQEDLTPEQAKLVEEIAAPLIAEFYP
jgi:LPS sulfotransferase NodH